MKIKTTITVTVDRADGSQAVIGQTTIKDAGDNLAFERHEAKAALMEASTAFIDLKGLGGTSPL